MIEVKNLAFYADSNYLCKVINHSRISRSSGVWTPQHKPTATKIMTIIVQHVIVTDFALSSSLLARVLLITLIN